MNFYDTFVGLCNKEGKTPSKVAAEIGISKSAVSRWKNGGGATDPVLMKLADYFGVSVNYLTGNNRPSGNMSGAIVTGSSIVIGDGKNIQSTVYNTGKEAELSSLEAGILEKVRKLSLEDQVKVFNFIMELNVQK